MTTTVEPGVERAALWRVLSLGFAPPSIERLDEVAALAEAIEETGAGPEISDLREAAVSAELNQLATGFQRLFGGSVLVAPYEGSYELDPIRQGRQMSDVAAFYRAFGAYAHGPAAERPDHVGCELEFLAFLELRRLTALETGDEASADLVEHITGSFLSDHAGRWLPTFFAQVRAEAHEPYYRTLAALGSQVVLDELERRGLEPAPLPRRHAAGSVEADELECGATASAE